MLPLQRTRPYKNTTRGAQSGGQARTAAIHHRYHINHLHIDHHISFATHSARPPPAENQRANTLRAGTDRGQAEGFEMAVLTKLEDTPGASGGTLLDHVAEVAAETHPEARLCFACPMVRLGARLVHGGGRWNAASL